MAASGKLIRGGKRSKQCLRCCICLSSIWACFLYVRGRTCLATLIMAHDFLTGWRTLFKDERGQKRSLDEAQARDDLWQQDKRYQELTPLRCAGTGHLRSLHPSEPVLTTSGLEGNKQWGGAGRLKLSASARAARQRTERRIEGALKVCAYRRKETGGPGASLCHRPWPCVVEGEDWMDRWRTAWPPNRRRREGRCQRQVRSLTRSGTSTADA